MESSSLQTPCRSVGKREDKQGALVFREGVIRTLLNSYWEVGGALNVRCAHFLVQGGKSAGAAF